MSSTPLDRLHTEFAEAIRTHTYMGPSASDPSILERTAKKNIRLTEVFAHARDQIEESLNQKSYQAKDAALLRTLQHDGRIFYQRYTKSTNSWTRWFLKCLARYTPDLLKEFLPNCFSNGMEKAEKETLKEFENYRVFLREKIKDLSKTKSSNEEVGDEPVHSFEEDENDIFDPEKDKISLEKDKRGTDSKKDTKEEEEELRKLREKREKTFKEKPSVGKETPVVDSLDEYNPEMQKLLAELCKAIKQDQQSNLSKSEKDQTKVKKEKAAPPITLDALLENLYKSEEASKTPSTPPKDLILSKDELEKAALKEATDQLDRVQDLLRFLNELDKRPLSLQKLKSVLEEMAAAIVELVKLDAEAQSSLEKLGIKDKTFDALKDPSFKASLESNDHEKVLEFLHSTPWHSGFEEALNQKGYIRFGLRTIVGKQALMLGNEDGKSVKENILQKYRGQIKITNLTTESLNELKELLNFLNKNDSCRPFSILLEVQAGEPLTPEFFDLLMKLKDRVAEVQVQGVQEIDFKKQGLSEDEELQFVRHLDSFHFPKLENIILSDHGKKDWTPQDFSHLLAICPKIEFLKECYKHSPSYKDIVIPSGLLSSTELDASGCTIDQASHLLSLFPHVKHISLRGLPYTDVQLFNLIKESNLKNIITLHLKNCKGLTTDSLVTLANLSELKDLALPDLPKGKLPLNQLPKFENPFKIKLLYTTSKATQPIAASLYTGPQNWAPVFQIPLARQGEAQIFMPNQKRLDPKSVAYWLHNRDYQNLKPQTGILTILADSNGALNDDNLIEFVQKFPKTLAISLYNCPNVTDHGIISLLKACPDISKLDLTGCPHITENLFLGDGNFVFLNKLKKLIVTDTGISPDVIATFNTSDQMGMRLEFEKTYLKITDDDLTDDDALENILQKNTLDKLKRIDLENCINLNDKMLGQLLDHLNAPIFIQTKEKTLIDNPQRLDLAVLNLKGCVNITDEAFHHQPTKLDDDEAESEALVKAKIEPRLLENLDRVIIGETQISDVLKEVYPQVTFQKFEEPITIEINPDMQLQECMDYHTRKGQDSLSEEEEKELKKLTARYLHNRISVELFCDELTQEAFEKPIDTQAKEFFDFTLSFKINDDAEPIACQAHRDILYYQSLYFVNRFRPGGKMSKQTGVVLTNVHGTPEAVQAVMDIFYGKPCIQDLDWQTAAHAAELVGTHNFNLSPNIYKALLKRIHSQFDLENAQDLLAIATCLDDKEGKNEYEKTLLFYLDNLGPNANDQEIFQEIANIAEGKHGLKQLQDKVAKIQTDKTNKLIKQEIDKQNEANEKKDEKLIQQIILHEKLSTFL